MLVKAKTFSVGIAPPMEGADATAVGPVRRPHGSAWGSLGPELPSLGVGHLTMEHRAYPMSSAVMAHLLQLGRPDTNAPATGDG
jgi:hypothetical protein